MTKDEALKLAKELEGVIADVENGDGFDDVCLDTVKYVRDCLAAIKQALEQPVASNDTSQDRVDETAKQRHEPVAWPGVDFDIKTSPPKREWRGLTDEEIHQAFCHVEYETTNNWHKNPESWCIANARYLESILKDRNT